MPSLTALVILLAVILYFWLGFRVGQARAKFGVKAPATTGNADFERVFRVQMNTLEWMPIFLPAAWLAAIYVSDILAAVLGLVWIAGRVLYMRGYSEAAEKRETGFFVQAIATGLLWAVALVGVLKALVHG
ncbi:MAG TPA: MAPEG family protein [Xanthobacteraceae bacterium]|jgi:glutathione S-transferase|nr:MAPEG family protein [Xanthobacteraceae bacterium]